jgi:hypothetical protein
VTETESLRQTPFSNLPPPEDRSRSCWSDVSLFSGRWRRTQYRKYLIPSLRKCCHKNYLQQSCNWHFASKHRNMFQRLKKCQNYYWLSILIFNDVETNHLDPQYNKQSRINSSLATLKHSFRYSVRVPRFLIFSVISYFGDVLGGLLTQLNTLRRFHSFESDQGSTWISG